MRYAATIVLSAAMGIHCSAPAASDARDERDIVAGPTVADDDGDRPKPERIAAPEPEREPAPAAPADGFVTIPSLVVTTVTGPDGARYIAGTYAGSIEVGGSTFTSSGKDDVFLARIEADGRVAWARSIGSLSSESGPHLSFDDGRLKLIATTRGDVDCGAGRLGKWNSEMFFMCVFDEAGSTVGGGVFPTGAK
jgi:hypothetical protein